MIWRKTGQTGPYRLGQYTLNPCSIACQSGAWKDAERHPVEIFSELPWGCFGSKALILAADENPGRDVAEAKHLITCHYGQIVQKLQVSQGAHLQLLTRIHATMSLTIDGNYAKISADIEMGRRRGSAVVFAAAPG